LPVPIDRPVSLCEQELTDTSGYFLHERCKLGDIADLEVIARVLSDEAALGLCDAFSVK
jgi:hypothetical protein